MANVQFSPALQKYANGLKRTQVDASTLREAIVQLDKKIPGFQSRIIGSSGEILRYVSIFVDNEDVKFLDKLNTPLGAKSDVVILVAMAGG